MFNFSQFAQWSTGKKLWLGILPPLTTILALLALSIVVAAGMWLWVGFWTGVYANLAAFIPMIGQGLAATLGITLLNFWFSRDINAAMLSTRDIRDDVKYGPTNPVDVVKMLNHLRHEVNAYFKKEWGDKHQDMPLPVLLTYTDDANFKIITIEGRNAGKSALIFSSGAFDMTRMNQEELAALCLKELVKLYLRRGPWRTFVSMLSDLATTLQNLNRPDNAWYYRFLGLLTGPLQWILLLERSISRSYEYEASEHVVKMGRGVRWVSGTDKKVCRTQIDFPLKSTLKKNQNLHKRVPYQGQGPIKSFADWVDQHEYPGADKKGPRWVSFFDCMVNYSLYYINESWNKLPRSTNEKAYVLSLIKAKLSNGKEVSMDSDEVTEEEKHRFYEQDKKMNSTLYPDIVKSINEEREEWEAQAKERGLNELLPSIKKRFQPYPVIGPEGNGCAPQVRDPGLEEIQAQILKLQGQLAMIEAQLKESQAREDQVPKEGKAHTPYLDAKSVPGQVPKSSDKKQDNNNPLRPH